MELEIKTSKRNELIDITSKVQESLEKSARAAVVSSMHTSCGVIINEGADPAVKDDILNKLAQMVPEQEGYKHAEGNSDSHVKTALVGNSVIIPVENGKLVLGTWQAIYLAEFDGPKTRKIRITKI